jgi:hypothetical protein
MKTFEDLSYSLAKDYVELLREQRQTGLEINGSPPLLNGRL